MALSPVDRDPEFMRREHGTSCLITDLGSEKFLKKAKKAKYQIPEDRMSRPCGGSGGFDDFVERWHE